MFIRLGMLNKELKQTAYIRCIVDSEMYLCFDAPWCDRGNSIHHFQQEIDEKDKRSNHACPVGRNSRSGVNPVWQCLPEDYCEKSSSQRCSTI